MCGGLKDMRILSTNSLFRQKFKHLAGKRCNTIFPIVGRASKLASYMLQQLSEVGRMDGQSVWTKTCRIEMLVSTRQQPTSEADHTSTLPEQENHSKT